MTILSLSNRFIEGYIEMSTIINSWTKIEVKKSSDIQGTLDSLKELMDLKGNLKCNLKVTYKGQITRYGFVKGEMGADELESKLSKLCEELG